LGLLSPQEIVVIGDRIHDINSAKQVGCSAILSNKNKLDSFNESLVISELLELKKINFSKIQKFYINYFNIIPKVSVEILSLTS